MHDNTLVWHYIMKKEAEIIISLFFLYAGAGNVAIRCDKIFHKVKYALLVGTNKLRFCHITKTVFMYL